MIRRKVDIQLRPIQIIRDTLGQWFSTCFRWRHTFLRKKNWRHIKNVQTTVLYRQVANYIYQKLEVKVLNYLATHQEKLATHKCVATPWLRTTALGGQQSGIHAFYFLNTDYKDFK